MHSAPEINRLIANEDFLKLASIVDSLPEEIENGIGLALFRGEIAAGRYTSARKVIEKCQVSTNEEQVVTNAYCSILDILESFDPETALDRICTCEENLPDSSIVRWVALRVRFAAIAAGHLHQSELESLRQTTLDTADRLKQDGHYELSDSAYILHLKHNGNENDWTHWIEDSKRLKKTGCQAEGYLGLANHRRKIGASKTEICTVLDEALPLYELIGHQTGATDIARVRTELEITIDGGCETLLSPFINRYLRIAYPTGAISALLTAKTIAYERGNLPLAEQHSRQLLCLAEKYGAGMIAQQHVLNSAKVATDIGDYSLARDLCDQALANPGPDGFKSGVHALKATALTFVGDHYRAHLNFEKAISLFLKVGRESSASNLIPTYAQSLAHDGKLSSIQSADKLLAAWIIRDEKAENHLGAADKWAMRAAIVLPRKTVTSLEERQLLPDTLSRSRNCLEEAKQCVSSIDTRNNSLTKEVQRLSAYIAQLSCQIALVAGEEQAASAQAQKAYRLYEEIQLYPQAANCAYMLAIQALSLIDLTDQKKSVHLAVVAEENLLRAYTFHREKSGLVISAADCAHKLVMLKLNVFSLLTTESKKHQLPIIEELLNTTQSEIDTLRRGFEAPNRVDSYTGKQTLSVLTAKLLAESLRLYLQINIDHVKAWSWVVQSKARALNDIVAIDSNPPIEIQRFIESHPRLCSLVKQERILVETLTDAPVHERFALNSSIDATREQIATFPEMKHYIHRRTGVVDNIKDLEVAFAGQKAAYVDWIVVNNTIWISVARPGYAPVFELIALSANYLSIFVEVDFTHPGARKSVLRDEHDLLRQLDPLIQPLSWLTEPDEDLIFCTTGLLRTLPLHALKIEGDYLIKRNPVSWTPSLALLRHTVDSAPDKSDNYATVFGQPDADGTDSTTHAMSVANLLSQKLISGRSVTKLKLSNALQSSQIVHFNGHSVFDASEPLQSHLRLTAGDKLTVVDIFAMRRVSAKLVTLGACESSVSRLLPGDEPLSMVASLLQSGVPTVVGALWKVRDRSTGLLMQHFYREMLDEGLPASRALQRAALKIESQPNYSSPYHWASMILSGNPWTKIAHSNKD